MAYAVGAGATGRSTLDLSGMRIITLASLAVGPASVAERTRSVARTRRLPVFVRQRPPIAERLLRLVADSLS